MFALRLAHVLSRAHLSSNVNLASCLVLPLINNNCISLKYSTGKPRSGRRESGNTHHGKFENENVSEKTNVESDESITLLDDK